MMKIPTYGLIITLLLFACQDDYEGIVSNKEVVEKPQEFEYDSNKNPFSLKMMQMAFFYLQEQEKLNVRDFPDFSIKTTHLYVKFKPRNEEEEGLIKADSTLFVFDYPLHLSELEEEVFLKKRRPLAVDEEELPIEFTFYYASVPLNEVSRLTAKFEVIDELYIPEEDPYFDEVDEEVNLETNRIVTNADLFENLINKAYQLAGREDELKDNANGKIIVNQIIVPSAWIFGSKWNPSGKLRIWDDEMKQLIPLKGAQVLMRQVFTVRQGISDGNGYFKTKSIRGKAKYLLQWERHHYSIRTNSFFQAKTDGPRVKKMSWNPDLKGGSAEYYGTIHHAAWMYYYTPRFGFASPPKNGFLQRQIKIAARKKSGTSSHVNERGLYFGNQISIQEWNKGSQVVFSTTIHELTHAAHFKFDRSSYKDLVKKAYIPPFSSASDGAKRLLETWATTAEIYLTNHWYRFVLGKSDFNFRENNFQRRLIYDLKNPNSKYYTSAGYDMIDYFNQRVYSINHPIDQVSGYTPMQLQFSLRGATHWHGWKDNIKTQHNNSTSVYLDELFNNW